MKNSTHFGGCCFCILSCNLAVPYRCNEIITPEPNQLLIIVSLGTAEPRKRASHTARYVISGDNTDSVLVL